jgi:preprotein translocase subunit Sec61beta
MSDTGFKLDVLSIVVAEIVFAILVILVKYILNKMGDR